MKSHSTGYAVYVYIPRALRTVAVLMLHLRVIFSLQSSASYGARPSTQRDAIFNG